MIVVSGEALIDVFAGPAPGPGAPDGTGPDARVGGSPFNVAVGLARLGQAVTFFGALSTGLLGERLLQALRQEGVGTDAVTRLDAPTTLSLVGLDAQGMPSYAFDGDGAADRLLPLEALERLDAALASATAGVRVGAAPGTALTADAASRPRRPAEAFHFGSYSLVVEPVATTLRALVEREHGLNLIAYDPNVRLHVEPSLERWRATFAWMQPRTHLLKASAEDLGLLFPGIDPATLAAEWLQTGTALVVVTRGKEGASAWTAAHHVEIRAARVTVVDTVGAGDAFQAALLAGLAERGLLTMAGLRSLPADVLAEVLTFATRTAGLTCARPGADLPRRPELV
jgi:fructokinase